VNKRVKIKSSKKSGAGMLSTIMVDTYGRSVYTQMDYNELGEPYEEVFEQMKLQPTYTAKTPTKSVNGEQKQKSHLGSVIDKSIRREMFVRIQKNLILLKVLADSTAKLGIAISQKTEKDAKEPLLNPRNLAEFKEALEQVKTSQRRISAVFSPLAYQLYPDQVDTLTSYMADLTLACAGNQDLPVGLLNEIELPRVQKEFVSVSGGTISSEPVVQNTAVVSRDKQTDNSGSAYLFSREYHLFLASIYLSEAVDQMEKVLGDEVEKLSKLIRPEVMALENACSMIHKIFTRSFEKQAKWAWRSDFKTI
jgi:hypothetical protein